MANLGSSSLVKADNAALAHDAAILGPIEEAKNATYRIFMNSETTYTEDTNAYKYSAHEEVQSGTLYNLCAHALQALLA